MRITNEMGLPQPFVSAVEKEYTYKPKRYSVTSILKGPREAILQRRHDDEITSDVSDMVWALFGTAVHSVLENAQETDDQLKENKIVVEMPNGYELSGIFDLYDDSTGRSSSAISTTGAGRRSSTAGCSARLASTPIAAKSWQS